MSGFVQSRSVYPGTSLAYSASVGAGRFLLVWLVWTSGTVTGVSGSLNGAFQLSATFGTGITKCALAYKYNCLGGAETISVAGGPTDLGFSIYEFSGIDTGSDPLDGSIVATTIAASTTTPTTSSFSNSALGLVFAGLGDEGTTQGTTTAGAGYTLGEFQGGHNHADEYALSVAAGSHTASFTLGTACSGSPDCVTAVACFRDAGAASVSIAPRLTLPAARGVRPVLAMVMRQLMNRVAPVVTSFNQTATPSAVGSTWSVASPTVVKGGVTLTPAAITSTWSTAAPTVLKTRSLTPSAVSSSWSAPAPSIALGARTLTPSAVPSTWAVAAPSVVTGGAVTIVPSAVSSSWQVAAPSLIRGTRTVTPGAVSSAWAFAAPALIRGARQVTPNAVGSVWSAAVPSLGGVLLTPTRRSLSVSSSISLSIG